MDHGKVRLAIARYLLEQIRLIILSWNPGPRRGTARTVEDHIAGKWHIAARGDRVPATRAPHESLLHYPCRWLCCPVQQGHLSLGHQSRFSLPPRQQKWTAASRERRTVRMGTTGSHLPCFVPKDGWAPCRRNNILAGAKSAFYHGHRGRLVWHRLCSTSGVPAL